MPTLSSITQFLDNLYTTTWQNRMPGVADNFFNATPFWWWLKEHNRMKTQRGGRFIEVNLEYASNASVSWVSKGTAVPLNDYEFLRTAQFDWRHVVANITRFGTDDQANAGQAKIMNLMNSKLDNTERSLQVEFEDRLTGGAGTITAATTTALAAAFDGLTCLVADDPTATSGGNGIAVGGIDSTTAANSWWRNKTKNMTGLSFATSGIDWMRKVYNDASNNNSKDAPDFLLSDQWTYEQYEAAVLPYFRTENRKMADLSFDNQTYKGKPWVWTPYIEGEDSDTPVGGKLYMLNTKHLSLIYDPAVWFDMTEWKPIPNQPRDRVAQIVCTCALLTDRRRVHAVLYNMDTA